MLIAGLCVTIHHVAIQQQALNVMCNVYTCMYIVIKTMCAMWNNNNFEVRVERIIGTAKENTRIE